jgi:hypothetical protein
MAFDIDRPELYDYAHVLDGVVVTVSVWDGETEYNPEDGSVLVRLPHEEEFDDDGVLVERRVTAWVGWSYRDGEFIDERPVDLEDED